MGFFSRVKQYAGKVISRGSHLAGKVLSHPGQYAGKIKNTLHDIRNFIDRAKKFAPIATEIVDELTDLVPGGSVAKKAFNYGLAGIDTLSNITSKAHAVAGGTESFINNPNAGSFKNLMRQYN